MWPCCIVTNFFLIKPTRCTNFTSLFCHETLHVSDSSSVHHQVLIHCTLSNGICHTGLYTTFEQDQDGTAVPLLSVQWINTWWWTEELSETCRVSWQNKFVKVVHLVGFITKILMYVTCMCTIELVAQVEGLPDTAGYSDTFPFVNSLFCGCTYIK
jgi:hypothetical protein